MPPRRKARGGKQAANPKATVAVKAVERPEFSPQTERPPEESTFKRQVKHAAYRLVAILVITLVTNHFKGQVSKTHDEVVPWKVVTLPGRGKGMLATRLIKQGERIMTERPLFVVPKQIFESPTQLINSQLDGLSPEQQDTFLELSHADSDSDIPKESIPLSIFQTNGISAGESGVGIFPKTARLNHGCSAAFNSVYTWREKERILVVHTLKEVQPGDELLTTYFDTKKPRHERRDYLAHAYKFNCSCQVCSLPEEASLASDMRLKTMTTAHSKFTTWGNQEINGLEALDLVRKIWRTGEEEGYWSERGRLAADAAYVAAAHSDEHATRQWAALAQEWYGYELGQDSEQAEAVRIIVQDPHQHAAWASREKMAVGDPNFTS